MLTLFYSPHSTSVDNEAGLASGWADVPLSPQGRQEAQELGKQYAERNFEAIFSSDLLRAVSTVELAFPETDIPVFYDKRLREYDYGDLTQAPREEIEALKMRTISEPFPDGQSLLTVVENIGQFLGEIMRDYDVRAVLIIGHSATRYALQYFCQDPAQTLEEIVSTPWLEVPIWRYDIDEEKLALRTAALSKVER